MGSRHWDRGDIGHRTWRARDRDEPAHHCASRDISRAKSESPEQDSLGGGTPADPPLGAAFLEHFQALLRSRARALFLYGRDDAEYQSFRVAERTVFARLTPEQRERIAVELWDGTVHGFLEMPRQRETFERAVSWIGALHPARAAAALPATGMHPRATEAAWTSA